MALLKVFKNKCIEVGTGEGGEMGFYFPVRERQEYMYGNLVNIRWCNGDISTIEIYKDYAYISNFLFLRKVSKKKGISDLKALLAKYPGGAHCLLHRLLQAHKINLNIF